MLDVLQIEHSTGLLNSREDSIPSAACPYIANDSIPFIAHG